MKRKDPADTINSCGCRVWLVELARTAAGDPPTRVFGRFAPPGTRAKRIAAQGYQVETRTVDAGDLASVSALIRDIEGQFGVIDVCTFNAASMRAATIETQAADTFVPDLTVNIGAALDAVQEASRRMLTRAAGTIVDGRHIRRCA